jgi:thiol-disulfide isomerase/thioredoxin
VADRKGIVRLTVLSIAVILATAGGCSAPGDRDEAGGRPAEPTLRPATAARVLEAARAPGAHATLINVWATWCQPCVEEFPDLVKLHRAYGDRGLRLVLVSADFDDQREAVLAFLRRQGASFPSYLKDQKDEDFIDGIDPRWSGALPASFVVDRTGAIVDFWEGKKNYAALEAKIAPLLR